MNLIDFKERTRKAKQEGVKSVSLPWDNWIPLTKYFDAKEDVSMWGSTDKIRVFGIDFLQQDDDKIGSLHEGIMLFEVLCVLTDYRIDSIPDGWLGFIQQGRAMNMLIFADWLEEENDSMSELIRIHCNLIRHIPHHFYRTVCWNTDVNLSEEHPWYVDMKRAELFPEMPLELLEARWECVKEFFPSRGKGRTIRNITDCMRWCAIHPRASARFYSSDPVATRDLIRKIGEIIEPKSAFVMSPSWERIQATPELIEIGQNIPHGTFVQMGKAGVKNFKRQLGISEADHEYDEEEGIHKFRLKLDVGIEVYDHDYTGLKPWREEDV